MNCVSFIDGLHYLFSSHLQGSEASGQPGKTCYSTSVLTGKLTDPVCLLLVQMTQQIFKVFFLLFGLTLWIFSFCSFRNTSNFLGLQVTISIGRTQLPSHQTSCGLYRLQRGSISEEGQGCHSASPFALTCSSFQPQNSRFPGWSVSIRDSTLYC